MRLVLRSGSRGLTPGPGLVRQVSLCPTVLVFCGFYEKGA